MHELSYQAQVHRLRELALAALPLFPLRRPVLRFIQHGENSTFRVDAGSRRYLLRVHRAGYHSEAAILEELAWLRRIAGDVIAPVPVRARSGAWLSHVRTARVPDGRFCDLLEWVHGSFLDKRARAENHIRELGALMASLQKTTRGRAVKHRVYWTADGLVGPGAKFGTIDHLPGTDKRKQTKITRARKLVYAKLRAFERRFPERQSLIHADLHFGNFVRSPRGLGAIDFDDCGFGFHAYDLAVPLTHLENMCAKEPKRYWRLFETIQEGYAAHAAWDEHDRAILPFMVAARRLLMLGWICSRQDNPRFRSVLPGVVERTLGSVGEI
jgi:Ser/Thr protein kinase RdoA (MazF antagonist)